MTTVKSYSSLASDAFFGLPIWAQWVAISVGKSVAASVLMSFLATYATLAFAIRHGFRAPLEGVPYLHLAVGLVTFVTFILTLLAFSIILAVVRWVRGLGIIVGEMLAGFVDAKSRFVRRGARFGISLINASHWFLSTRVFFGTAIAAIGFVGSMLLSPQLAYWFNTVVGSNPTWSALDLILRMLLVVVAVMAIWAAARNWSWIAAQVLASLLIFTMMAIGLFANDVYGSFLRVIRYGGGIDVAIKYFEAEGKALREAKGSLIVLTSTALVLFNENRQEITEYPLKIVAEINYLVQPPWSLPTYGFAQQGIFIELDFANEPPLPKPVETMPTEAR